MLGAAIYGLTRVSWSEGAESEIDALTYTVGRTTLRDTIVERGTLESQSTVNGVCQLHGYRNKITFIVEEGAPVKAGDVVVEFDASEIEKEIAQKKIKVTAAEKAVTEATQQIEVQKNKNESDIAAARLEKELADLDLEKYEKGDYIAELADHERSIAESEAALAQFEDQLKNTKVLVKKGFREPEQLRQLERQVTSARFQVERDRQRKEILEKFQYRRQITELKNKADEAARKLERAIANASSEMTKAESELARANEELEIEREELEELQEQLEHSVIKAPHAGTVAYANRQYMDPEYKIRSGGTVYRNQVVFFLPDLENMQVNLEVHESVVNKLAIGQPATIRVDSYPDHEFRGKVSKVSDLARSDYGIQVKAYSTVVTIDSIPEGVRLKPGMTAEVEVLTRTLEDVMVLPVQAVTQYLGLDFAFVKKGNRFERKMIEVREGNEAFLIVEEGLDVGDVVALDAYQRGLTEFASLDSAEEDRLKQIRAARLEAVASKTKSETGKVDAETAASTEAGAEKPSAGQESGRASEPDSQGTNPQPEAEQSAAPEGNDLNPANVDSESSGSEARSSTDHEAQDSEQVLEPDDQHAEEDESHAPVSGAQPAGHSDSENSSSEVPGSEAPASERPEVKGAQSEGANDAGP